MVGGGLLFISALRNSLSHNSSSGAAHTDAAFVEDDGRKKFYFCSKNVSCVFTHRPHPATPPTYASMPLLLLGLFVVVVLISSLLLSCVDST